MRRPVLNRLVFSDCNGSRRLGLNLCRCWDELEDQRRFASVGMEEFLDPSSMGVEASGKACCNQRLESASSSEDHLQ
jgi:hypothetical protein